MPYVPGMYTAHHVSVEDRVHRGGKQQKKKNGNTPLQTRQVEQNKAVGRDLCTRYEIKQWGGISARKNKTKQVSYLIPGSIVFQHHIYLVLANPPTSGSQKQN